MKSLWMLCVLAAGLALGGACGPQKEFCPNTGKDGVCPILGDDASNQPIDSGAGANTGNLCPSGQHGVSQPDGTVVCVPNS
jgi:hypothetical protein